MEKIEKPEILIVDDHSIVTAGVKLLLNIEVPSARTDEAASAFTMAEKLKTRHYDLIILDINMPDTDIYNCILSVIESYPGIRILVFSMSPEEIYALRFFKLGIYGFVSKEAPKSELITAINEVLSGKKYFSVKTMKLLTENLTQSGAKANSFNSLSRREFEIMTYLIKGKSIKEISADINLHSSTIGTHKAKIFEKLGVNNQFELRQLAEAYGIGD